MDKSPKAYSFNREYYFSSLQEAMNNSFGFLPEEGEEIFGWEADKVYFKASDFFHLGSDDLINNAYDEVGEMSDIWDFSREEENSLEKELKKALDDWCDKNNKHPEFWGVKNEREIKFVIPKTKNTES